MRQYVWIAFAAFTFLVHPLVSFSQTVEPNPSVFKNNYFQPSSITKGKHRPENGSFGG